MNFLKKLVNGKSAVKAVRDIGLGVVGVAVPAGLAYLDNPEVFAPLVTALGPFGLLAAPALAVGVKYLQDAWKHRNEGE